MAASDKSKKGNRTDYAKHYSLTPAGNPLCGNKRYGYSTPDKTDVDCEKCLKQLNK